MHFLNKYIQKGVKLKKINKFHRVQIISSNYILCVINYFFNLDYCILFIKKIEIKLSFILNKPDMQKKLRK